MHIHADGTAGTMDASTRCTLSQAAELQQQRALVASLQRALQDAVPYLVVDSTEALTLAVQQLVLSRKGAPLEHCTLRAMQQQCALLTKVGCMMCVWLRSLEGECILPTTQELQSTRAENERLRGKLS